ncbi:hypothetical protein [Streptomyces sp. NPDC055189]
MLLKSKSTQVLTDGIDLHTLLLPLSGRSLRIGRGHLGEPTLDLYSGQRLLDTFTAGRPTAFSLRNAVYGTGTQGEWTLAWGQLTPGTDDLRLAFRLPRTVHSVSPVTIADHFWVAETAGTYDSVAAFPHRVSRATHAAR